MNLHSKDAFVGFGFGAIQAGLLAFEARRSGTFGRVVLAEVVPELVEAIRSDGGHYGLNIAHLDRVESVRVGPVEILDPATEADRDRLVRAVAEASELATAIPSVRFYRGEQRGSVHRILARGLREGSGRHRVIYAAENHLAAAEQLRAAVLEETPPDHRSAIESRTCFVNTVIGKMSAVITDPAQIEAAGLVPIASGIPKAFLVESFRHILMSRVEFPQGHRFQRGLGVFEEKPCLEPFEEAKLYGHNALHALAGYIAAALGLVRLSELREHPRVVELIRQGFIDEAGAALVARWSGVDRLFTTEGFSQHVDDLIERMLNPHLGDIVERITRDPERKLGWNDRLIGPLRLSLEHGIRPVYLPLGAAAALYAHRPDVLESPERAADWLTRIWRDEKTDPDVEPTLIRLISQALDLVRSILSGPECLIKKLSHGLNTD